MEQGTGLLVQGLVAEPFEADPYDMPTWADGQEETTLSVVLVDPLFSSALHSAESLLAHTIPQKPQASDPDGTRPFADPHWRCKTCPATCKRIPESLMLLPQPATLHAISTSRVYVGPGASGSCWRGVSLQRGQSLASSPR